MALRVASALPSVLETSSLSPSHAQAQAARMLHLVARHLLEPPELNGGSVDLRFDQGSELGLPTLGAFLASLGSYLHERLGSCDGALRLESVRSLLSTLTLLKVRCSGGTQYCVTKGHLTICLTLSSFLPSTFKAYAANQLSDSSSSAWVLSLVPEPWACLSVTSLMALEGRQLIEGGLEDIVEVVASNLKALPVSHTRTTSWYPSTICFTIP